MSTSAEVEAQWLDKVFKYDSIKTISPKAYPFEVTEESEKEVSRLYHAGEINFWMYLIARSHEFQVTNRLTYNFTVELSYYREMDPEGENWTAVRDNLETLFGVVRSSLGNTWQSTVDFWRPQAGIPNISLVKLGGKQVWRGVYIYTGFQEISI